MPQQSLDDQADRHALPASSFVLFERPDWNPEPFVN